MRLACLNSRHRCLLQKLSIQWTYDGELGGRLFSKILYHIVLSPRLAQHRLPTIGVTRICHSCISLWDTMPDAKRARRAQELWEQCRHAEAEIAKRTRVVHSAGGTSRVGQPGVFGSCRIAITAAFLIEDVSMEISNEFQDASHVSVYRDRGDYHMFLAVFHTFAAVFGFPGSRLGVRVLISCAVASPAA